jgi:hypothetical protein
MNINSIFSTVVTTLVGAALGAIISAYPQQQKQIANTLIATTGGIVTAWIGFALGKNQGKKEAVRLNPAQATPLPLDPKYEKPRFTIITPTNGGKIDAACTVSGSFEDLSEEDKNLIWLYVNNGRKFLLYQIQNIEMGRNQWRVNDVTFIKKENFQGKDFECQLQVVRVTVSAGDAFYAARSSGLDILPPGIEDISNRVNVIVFF